MSIWILIISLICFGSSVWSMKSLFKSKDKMQAEFITSYNKVVKSKEDENTYLGIITLFAILYTGMWINFYVVAFNVFNYQLLVLSLVAVFYMLQSIYNLFKGVSMLIKKEIKTSLINKFLNVVELFYVGYFIYYYVTIFGSRGF